LAAKRSPMVGAKQTPDELHTSTMPTAPKEVVSGRRRAAGVLAGIAPSRIGCQPFRQCLPAFKHRPPRELDMVERVGHFILHEEPECRMREVVAFLGERCPAPESR
jgi:hypothetical protein